MTLHRRTFTLSILATFLSGCGILSASDGELDRQTLKGMKSVSVAVENLDAGESRDGLSVSQIQTDVELRLRLAGIKVDPRAYNYLYVNPTLLKSGDLYAYNIGVELKQKVIVFATSESSFTATWSTGGVGIVGSSKMSEGVRKAIGDYVDKFINAYLSVNPK